MEKITHILRSRYDGLELSLLAIKPEGEIRGIIQIVHGMSEYKERYLPLMEYMAQRGFLCVIYDQRGHGESVRTPEDLGYMYGGGGNAMLEDLRLINSYLRYKYPHYPYIMLGHSMGTLVVRSFLKKYDRHIQLAILSGSPSKNQALPLGRLLSGLQKKLLGGHSRGSLIELLNFGAYAMRFPQEKSRFSWTCSDPRVVKEYEQSPLCGFTFTIDGYEALFDLMEETYSEKGWRCQRPKLPILFVSGGDDPCMGNVRKFKQTLDFLRMRGYRNVRGKIYPGMRHEILNEPQKETIYHDLYCYINKTLQ